MKDIEWNVIYEVYEKMGMKDLQEERGKCRRLTHTIEPTLNRFCQIICGAPANWKTHIK